MVLSLIHIYPFLYQAEVTLFRNGQMVDRVTQPLGLRFYRIDPDKGFFLNGKHLPLQGVCRHQDRSEVGNALRPQHHEEDVALMLEMGVNAVRLAHYPQATYFYDLMDKNGIIAVSYTHLIDVGFDLGLLDNRLNMVFDWYRRDTTVSYTHLIFCT